MEKLIVVKVGTNVLTCDGEPGEPSQMDINNMLRLARDISRIREETGNSVILVTSGAVGFGDARKNLRQKLSGKDPVKVKQALAAYGQRLLMDKWADAFAQASPSRNVAQYLMTHNNLKEPDERRNLLDNIRIVLQEGDIPIVNENDAVVSAEIRFGDNDQLASRLAFAAGAEGLVLLTDVRGVYAKNPVLYPDAKLLEKINAGSITKHFIGDAAANWQMPFRLEIKMDNGATVDLTSGAEGNKNGTGGIASKVDAAKYFVEKTWCSAVIANGKEPGVLRRVLRGENVGTVIVPE